MKTAYPAIPGALWWARMLSVAAAASGALLVAGCSGGREETPRASSAIEGGKLVVAGARPLFPAGVAPTPGGFFEDVRWDESIQTLQVKGWSPHDVRHAGVRFVLRDPFDRLQLAGAPIFNPMERPDVAAAHPARPEWLHAGFTASVRLANVPPQRGWLDALELYALDDLGGFFRLAKVHAPAHHSWDRQPERFEIVLTYAPPPLTAPEQTVGSLDVFEEAGAPGTVRLAGWASFDGRSPRSALVLRLPPSAAPASIVSCIWVPRPDVRAAVDPQREELDRCGFDVILEINGSLEAFRRSDGLRVWSVDAAQNAVVLGLPGLRGRR